eukprot:TRINITY_DN538_c0_g6_i2.p1 TRINITY_DN538_c0_g6~~TRINITY_DN538_c0_g6_i2.p1  ORF type:complete len:1346 (-),score=250.04 TRINITY_DN538_c0_g6_i2:351-4388(-)
MKIQIFFLFSVLVQICLADDVSISLEWVRDTRNVSLVTVGQVAAGFKSPPPIRDLSTEIPASMKRADFRWRLEPLQATYSQNTLIPYRIMSIVNPTELSLSFSVPTFGYFNFSRNATWLPLSIDFRCSVSHSIKFSLTIIVGASLETQATLYFSKRCSVNCTRLCSVAGRCTSDGCVCQPEFNWTPLCTFGFWLEIASRGVMYAQSPALPARTPTTLSACPGDTIAIKWQFFPDSLSLGDPSTLLAVNQTLTAFDRSQFLEIWPPASNYTAEWTFAMSYQKISISDSSVYGSRRPLSDWYSTSTSIGTLLFTIDERLRNDEISSYGVAYMGGTSVFGLTTVQILPQSHPSCLPPNMVCPPGNRTVCSQRGACAPAGTHCVCDRGYFGPNCESGCDRQVLTAYGQDFTSSVDGRSVYLNKLNCSWWIQPNNVTVTAVVVRILKLSTEPDYDVVTVASANGTVLARFSGQVEFSNIVRVPGNAALVSFTTDSGNPSMSYYGGWTATYYAEGCAPGNYIARINSTWGCVPCPLGSYSDKYDQLSCTACPAGFYSDVPGLSRCKVCAQGSSTSGLTGAVTCTDCSPGYYADSSASPLCTACPPGTFSSRPGTTQCTNCGLFAFNPSPSSVFCFACPINTQTQVDQAQNVSQCHCKPGYYDYNRGVSIQRDCRICPVGGVCAGFDALPIPNVGYWAEKDPEEFVFYQCLAPGTCEGGKFGDDGCRDGHEGKMCFHCEKGYTKDGQFYCKPCSGQAASKIPLAIVGLILIALILLAVTRKQPFEEFMLQRPSLGVTFGIALTFIQIIATFAKYSMNWPEEVVAFYSVISGSNLNVEILSPTCSTEASYTLLFRVKLLLPLFLACIYGLMIALALVQRVFVRVFGQRFIDEQPQYEALLVVHEAIDARPFHRRYKDEHLTFVLKNMCLPPGKRVPWSIALRTLSASIGQADPDDPTLKVVGPTDEQIQAALDYLHGLESHSSLLNNEEYGHVASPQSHPKQDDSKPNKDQPASIEMTPRGPHRLQPSATIRQPRFSVFEAQFNNEENKLNRMVEDNADGDSESHSLHDHDQDKSLPSVYEIRSLKYEQLVPRDGWLRLPFFKRVAYLWATRPASPFFLVLRSIRALVFFINLFYIFLVTSATELFDCYTQPNGTASLTAYPLLECYSPEWLELLPFSVWSFIIYGLGLPVLFSICVISYRVFGASDRYLMEFIDFWRPFSYNVCWWGLVQILRKLLLSIAVVSVTKDPNSKLVSVFLILFCSTYIQAQYRPYRHTSHNNLEFRMHMVAILVLLSSMVFANQDLNRAVGSWMRYVCFFSLVICVALCVLETLKIGRDRFGNICNRIRQVFLGA